MQGTIRQVHLMADNPPTLMLIISLLTPNDGGGQNEGIESIVLHSDGSPALDVLNFLARSRLPRLRSLDLYGNVFISSWDRLIPRTTLLTNLLLDINSPSPTPPNYGSAIFNPHLESKSSGALPDQCCPDRTRSHSRECFANLRTIQSRQLPT